MRRGLGWAAAVTGLVAGAGCGGGGTAAAPRPPAVAALIAKLQARDARIRTAYLPYGIVESGPRAGAPSTGWWALGAGISSWAALLAWSPRVEVLGRETVAGRDCVKVVCDTPSEAPAPPGGWA